MLLLLKFSGRAHPLQTSQIFRFVKMEPPILSMFSSQTITTTGVTVTQAGTGLTLTGNTFSITNTAVTAASYGSASKTLTATVNAQGQLTALSASDIAIPLSQVTDAGTMASQNASGVNITGGSIQNLTTFNGITIDGGTF